MDDEDCINEDDKDNGENIEAYSRLVKIVQSYVSNKKMELYYYKCMKKFETTVAIEKNQSYFVFKFFNKFLIDHFEKFFRNNGFSTNEYHSIFNNSIVPIINDGKRKLVSIDINDEEELEQFVQNIITSNNKIIESNLVLDQKVDQLLNTKINFTKYIVSKSIQYILKLLKHFKIVPESSVIRNNNGNFGVDFLKSFPNAKSQLIHTDYKNFEDNNNNFIGASVIINFEEFPFSICLVIANKTLSVTVNPQCFIFFHGTVEHCGTSNNTSFDINKIFFFIDKDSNYRGKKNVLDSVFFTTNHKINNTSNFDNNNNLIFNTDTNNLSGNNTENFKIPTNIIVDDNIIITDNNTTRKSKRFKEVKNNDSGTEAKNKNNKKIKTKEVKNTIITQLKLEYATSTKYSINNSELSNHKNFKTIEKLKNKNIICKTTIKTLNKEIKQKVKDNRLITRDFKKIAKELAETREELRETKQKLVDLENNVSINNRLNFDEYENFDQVSNTGEYENSNSSNEWHSFSNNNAILKTNESIKQNESIINTLSQKDREVQDVMKKKFAELNEVAKKYKEFINTESSDDDSFQMNRNNIESI